MSEWLGAAADAIAREAGIDRSTLDLSEGDKERILEVAAFAAHESGARLNAPLLCYLLGRASREAELEQLAAAVRATVP
jgi:AcrR family transcriptional regulator